MDWLRDTRTECWSVLTTTTVRDYMTLVEKAHASRGALEGQRDILRTTTAKRIRSRMVEDIRAGAVLPPVVIGAVVGDADFEKYPFEDAKTIAEILPEPQPELSIIDGMQRTAALVDANQLDPSVFNRDLRVEVWLARNVRSLVYRMLVLNTGQVPWTLSRQLTVVFRPLLAEIRNNVPEIDKVSSADKPGRRVAPAQYSADELIELYLAFSLRKTTVDQREALSEEFSRLDFVENLSDEAFQPQFYSALSLLAQLDTAFSRYEPAGSPELHRGRSIFDRQPARIGFMVALAQFALGRPGQDRPSDERKKRMLELEENACRLANTLDAETSEHVGEFLKLDVLSEILDRRVGQVGRYERAVFFEAFKALIEERFDVPDMELCWRAN